MSILKELFLYEIKYRLKSASTYLYFGIFFILSFLLVALAATETKGGGVNIVGVNSTKIFINSGFAVFSAISFISLFAIFVFPPIFGRSIYRDLENNTHAIYFSMPITKFNYVSGRFLGSLVIMILILLSIGLGAFSSQLFPTANPARFTEFQLYNYLNPYFQLVIPNAICIGAILFSMVLLFRQIMMVYVASAILFVSYFIAFAYMVDVEMHSTAILCDPFGLLSYVSSTRYWTINDKNTLDIPFTSIAIANRLLYFALAAVIFIISYRKFSLSGISKKTKKNLSVEKDESISVAIPLIEENYSVDFSANANRKLLFATTRHEFFGIVKSFYFKVLLVTTALLLLMEPVQLGSSEIEVLPFTGYFLQNIKAGFTVFGLIILSFCAGELVWTQRNNRLNPLFDALPVPTWLMASSKLIALLLIQFVFMLVILVCGVVLQTSKGFYNYEFDIYFKDLFGFTILNYFLYATLTLFVHVMVNNKFLGHFVMLIFYILTLFYDQLGIHHHLFRYAESPEFTFSEMNEFGHHVLPFYAYKFYWVLFAGILIIISFLFWIRGNETSFKYRLKLAGMRFTKNVKIVTLLLVCLFLGSGAYIYYNTNILNTFQSKADLEQFAIDYETKYKQLQNRQELTITDVRMNVDIFPEERSFNMKGSYWLKNKTKQIVDSVVVYLNRQLIINHITFNHAFTPVLNDLKLGQHIFQLKQALRPNDSIKFTFDYEYSTNGFVNNDANTDIVFNGTFLSSEKYVPVIGYNKYLENTDDDTRKQYGLAPAQRAFSINDSSKYHIPSGGFHLINFDAVLSTSANQTAIAPGHLVKQWKQKNRNYFHYKPERKITNFYAFLSADYAVKKENYHGVNLEIYYLPKHTYNTDRMMLAMKRSLNYYTKHFSPYQFKDLRIVEFPYQYFAQSFPGTIPFSENIGFTEKYDIDSKGIEDLAFMTEHEIAHQWWGQQVCAADVQGATMIIESLCQYSSLMVLKEEFTKKQMTRYLRYEMDRYLRVRTKEQQKEMPLYLVEDQSYIHYQKANAVMWALHDYIGEKNINTALRKIIDTYAFNETIYPTTKHVITELKAVTPDSLQYIITDLFETITLYENKAVEATVTKTVDGKYLVKLTINAKKLRADPTGKESEISINDWIDIGIVDKNDEPIYLVKHKINKSTMTFEIKLDKEPFKAGVDVFHKLIDKNIKDNLIEVSHI